ncbi:MAG: hypothetical protein IMZ52_10105 [Actinobacteria bacterium]|nr:hypothetical protein [Actinomycetota bacterium]MBE3122581.1 hypothetical protein [Thermoplasmata archaeon]
MNWFTNPFLGSQIPITYETQIEFENEFTGNREKIIQREIVGFVYTDNLSKFMQDMKMIQDEVRI